MTDLHALAMEWLGTGAAASSEDPVGAEGTAPLFFLSKEGDAGVFATVSGASEQDKDHDDTSEDENNDDEDSEE